MKRLLILFVVFTLVFALKSEARPIKFSIKINWGSYEKGACDPTQIGICSIIISLRTVASSGDTGSEIFEVQGEVANNMLILNLPKAIGEKGRNARGQFAFSVPKEMVLDQDLAKELGLEKLVIAPGNYEFKGNTLSLNILNPRETGSGLPTGKRQHGAITISK